MCWIFSKTTPCQTVGNAAFESLPLFPESSGCAILRAHQPTDRRIDMKILTAVIALAVALFAAAAFADHYKTGTSPFRVAVEGFRGEVEAA